MSVGGTTSAAVVPNSGEQWLDDPDGISRCALDTSKEPDVSVFAAVGMFSEFHVAGAFSGFDALGPTCGEVDALCAFSDPESGVLDRLGESDAMGRFSEVEAFCMFIDTEHGTCDAVGASDEFGTQLVCGS